MSRPTVVFALASMVAIPGSLVALLVIFHVRFNRSSDGNG